MGERTAVMLSCLFLAIVISPTLVSATYKVYWNIPTELCKVRYNISFQYAAKEYGITMNENDMFRGSEVTILYTPGMYPEVKGYKYDPSLKVPDMSSLTMINGGIPQNGNMLKHLDAFELFLNKTVPDTKNKGLIVIDMEHFGATWAQNFNDMEIYRILSRKRVQDKNPTWTTAKVEAQAILEYERAATNFIVKTMQYGKALRPYAQWGYYQYPQCFNRVGVDFCSKTTQADNDQMIQVWRRSDALYPSTYMDKIGTIPERKLRVKGQVKEASRVFAKVGKKDGLVIPYITYTYFFEEGFIDDKDLESLIATPKEEGAHGVILWGSSIDFATEEKCKLFDKYVQKSIGPISKKYVSN